MNPPVPKPGSTLPAESSFATINSWLLEASYCQPVMKMESFFTSKKRFFYRRRKRDKVTMGIWMMDPAKGWHGSASVAIRRANASAVATGASRGVQAAQELASILGLEQESTMAATELAQARANLGLQEAEALSKDVMEALTYADDTKYKAGQIARDLYTADTQFNVGHLPRNTFPII